MTMNWKLQAVRDARSYTIYLFQARLTMSNVWRCRRRRRRRRSHRRRHRHPNSPAVYHRSIHTCQTTHSTIQHVQLPGLAVPSTWCAQ